MRRGIIFGLVVVLALGALVWFFLPEGTDTVDEQYVTATSASYNDATYSIDGTSVALTNGSSAVYDPSSGATTTTRVFGNEIEVDLNADGTIDAAFVLAVDGGGSGTFYYAAAALNFGERFEGTNAIFLGDRIAPQTTEFQGGVIIFNYADRAQGEPMSAEPSVGVSKYFKLDGLSLVETNEVPEMNWVLSPITSSGTQFSYPASLSTEYLLPAEWPPKVELTAGQYSCEERQSETSATEHRLIDGRTYCRTISTEGAAGSTYTSYEFTTAQGDFVVNISFTLRAPHCTNYDESVQDTCTAEQESFNADTLADRIAASLRVL